MASTILLAIAAMAVQSAAASAASPTEDPIWRDTAAWRAFDWNQLERSNLWRESKEAPATARGPVRVRPGLTIGGLSFNLRIANLPANPRQPAALLVGASNAPGACRQAGRWLAEVFGTPTRTARIAQNYGDFDVERVLAQWSVGRTMVTSECEAEANGAAGSVLVRFESVTLARVVSDPVRLTCAFDGRKPFDILLVDYYGKLFRSDHSEIPGQLGPLMATAMLPSDFGDDGTITIDRQTGVLKSELDHGSSAARGLCKAAGPGRAF